MPRQDLSAFVAPRAVAANRLTPRRRPPEPAPPASPVAEEAADAAATQQEEEAPKPAVVPAPPAATPPPTQPARPRPAPSTAAPRQKSAPDAAARPGGQIIVYLKDAVADRLRAAAQQSSRTHLQLIVDAIDATHPELPQLLEAAGYVDRRNSSLFGEAMKGVRRRSTGERKTQIGLRPPAAVLGVIDQLVIDCAAPHRSALVEVALDKHLPSS
jgi:hypothetical protein